MKLWRPHSTLETCEGLCHHGILVVGLPYITKTKARAEGCLLVGFCVYYVVCRQRLHVDCSDTSCDVLPLTKDD
jgi:hypothetical protein